MCCRRVLLLGGLAVIAHGLSRATKDADVWMEPLASTIEWAAAVAEVAGRFPKIWLARLPGWSRVDSLEAIDTAARETGIVRVFGLECPLDIFRRPNELDEADFDAVWSRSTPMRHGVRLPEPLDILHSKLETGRPGNLADLAFLEAKIHSNFGQRLKTASVTEAREIFDRYIDHVVAEQSLGNPNPAVQSLAKGVLRELAGAGGPFSRDILLRLKIGGT